MRKTRQYTDAQRREVLAFGETHGLTAAARKFKISPHTIYGWRARQAKTATSNGHAPVPQTGLEDGPPLDGAPLHFDALIAQLRKNLEAAQADLDAALRLQSRKLIHRLHLQ